MRIEFCADRFRGQCQQHTAGFILVPVLWLLALLSVLGLSFIATTRLEIRTRSYLTQKAELQLLADGLAQYISVAVVGDAFNQGRQARLPVDGRPLACSIEGKAASVSIADVTGLVDLNAAPQEALVKLLRAAGASASEAGSMAAAIIDFRDGDDTPVSGGAEAEAYQTEGRPFGPKNSPFETVSELDQVLGLSPEIFERVKPLVTVYARRPEIDLSVAPIAILAALKDKSNQLQFSELERARAESAGFQRAALGSRAFDIRVNVANEGGFVAGRQTVIEIAPENPRGFEFREWALDDTPRDRSTVRSNRALCFDLF